MRFDTDPPDFRTFDPLVILQRLAPSFEATVRWE
jgi:hypothetical protein